MLHLWKFQTEVHEFYDLEVDEVKQLVIFFIFFVFILNLVLSLVVRRMQNRA